MRPQHISMEKRKGANERELEILGYWEKNKIFERSVSERPKDDPFVFYDGPPFATGLPHYGHLVGSTIKDVIPRFWTMRGKRVERVWGWDCHGLPVENIVEKELDLGDKKKIEAYGIGKFNDACETQVLKYAEEWKKVIHRFGRWVDMDSAYRTMDVEYMESVWWVFKQLWDKEKIYQGYRPMHICPRCATTLSASEVGLEYQDITDISVTARFKLRQDENTSLLAWTTTPWTLPGNMLVAVGADIDYIKAKQRNEILIVAKNRADEMLDGEYEVMEELKGSDLVGLEYKPLFSYFVDAEKSFRVVSADFVSDEDGTGLVHVAPGFGDDDFRLGQDEGLDIIRHVNIDGTFTEEVKDFAGDQAKPSDKKIVEWLASHGLVYTTKQVRHSYPHCWRCDTPLLNYATESWFVKVSELNNDLLRTNAETNWVPSSIKDGRFGNWLEGARDWSVSRSRYWGTPLPVWKSETSGDFIVVGSVDELEKLTGEKVDNLHKHIIDDLVFEKDGQTYRRIPEVLDCWFESGSMPYAQMHYPFENKDRFEKGFPADFIAEGQDQTRGWFYTLHVLSTILFDKPAFQNVIVNGIVLAENGKKMSKKLKNYPDPMEVIESFGADAVRFYLMSSPVVRAENLRFKESGVKEVSNKLIGTLANVLSFYKLFVTETPEIVEKADLHVLDRWVLSRLAQTRDNVTKYMEEYELSSATREIQEFVTELSQWYVRRSRDRFKTEGKDAQVAARVLHRVLETVSQIAAPFIPFMSEYIYRGLQERDEADSVHLSSWPTKADLDFFDQEALDHMVTVRELVSKTLEAREAAKMPVRQVLGALEVASPKKLDDAYLEIIANEVNVQKVAWKMADKLRVNLNVELTPELKQLGLVREITRQGNSLRKALKLTIDDEVVLHWETDDDNASATFEKYGEEISERVRAAKMVRGMEGADEQGRIETDDGAIDLGVTRA
jgi:isoleucyl-tRNA synthetase